MKFTFDDSKKFANVHIFEAIKKEPDTRVWRSRVLCLGKNPAFLKENLVFFCKVVFAFAFRFYIPAGFKVSDVKFVFSDTFI